MIRIQSQVNAQKRRHHILKHSFYKKRRTRRQPRRRIKPTMPLVIISPLMTRNWISKTCNHIPIRKEFKRKKRRIRRRKSISATGIKLKVLKKKNLRIIDHLKRRLNLGKRKQTDTMTSKSNLLMTKRSARK